MAVLLQQVMPEGVDSGMLDEVSAEMGVEGDPPTGLIVHVHYMKDGRAHVVDVWESAQKFHDFEQNRLVPAIQKVMERRGAPMGGPPDTSIIEVDGVVKG